MRIALIGYGKMGHEIEAAAREQGESIACTFDIDNPVDAAALSDVDVCIEFSTPQTVLQNIRVAVQARKDIVVGTTGWYERLPEIRPLVKDSGLLYSPNFSIGVNMVFRLAAAAAEMMNNAPAYDPYIHEWHHRQKADSPSGTALRLAEILLSKVERKKTIKKENVDGKIDPAALHVSSTRVGTVAGTHILGFESDADSIEIKHVAKTRRGFALGAVRAAQWLKGRKGVYTMDDVEL
jgi:4-hydroxy-tetrahydrodipicolinate reductase